MAGEVQLNDVAEIIMGQSPPGSTYNESGVGLPFFQGVRDFNYRHPSIRVFCSEPTRIALPGDILFSVRAPIGRVNIAEVECSIGRGLSIIRARSHADRKFIEFALRNMEQQWQVIEGGGSVFGNATRRDLATLSLPWPGNPLEREAIGYLLGALDDKIELNRTMNRTLEATARAIFKSWFVDFDPVHWNSARRLANIPRSEPGKWFIYAIECEGGSHYIGFTDDLHRRFDEHCRGCGADWTKAHPPVRLAYWEPVDSQAEAVAREQKLKSGSGREWLKAEIARNWTPRRPLPAGRQVKPEIAALFPDTFEPSELGEIPKGWKSKSVDDFAEIKGGKQLARQKISSTGPVPVFGGAGIMGYTTEYNAEGFVITVGRVGAYCGQFFSHRGKAWVNNNASHIRPADSTLGEWLFLSLLHANINILKKGAAQPFVANSDIANMLLIWPGQKLVHEFSQLLIPIIMRTEMIQEESRTLAALRDTLLPKLISGELRVPDAERIAGRCL